MISLFSQLSHVEHSGEYPYFVTMDGRVGIILRVGPVDVESDEFLGKMHRWTQAIARIKEGIQVRFHAKASTIYDDEFSTFRRPGIAQLGGVVHELYLTIETVKGVSSFAAILSALRGKKDAEESRVESILQGVDFTNLEGLSATPVSAQEIPQFFIHAGSEVAKAKVGVETGTEYIGVIRFWKQGVHGIAPDTLARLREQLPVPYEIVQTLRKIPEERAEFLLSTKLHQGLISKKVTAGREVRETATLLQKATLEKRALFEMEWLLLFRRSSDADVKEATKLALRAFSRPGEVSAEVVGATPSYAATFPGSDIHYGILEFDEPAVHYAPLFIRGEGRPKEKPPARSLTLHRRDFSLFYFDPFAAALGGANILITGRRGSGKSAVANLLSSSWLCDPNIILIKVDVGGSYVKECEMVGGRQIQFSLGQPSGLNPFDLLKVQYKGSDSGEFEAAIRGTLGEFLETLMLENNEKQLSSQLKGQLEDCVLDYMELKVANPSLNDFIARSKNLPRPELWKRWGTRGIFGKVFEPVTQEALSEREKRYTYFNFETLQNASNQEFARAVMAAVIANVNYEMLKCGNARTGNGKRVMFFCDEVPFFIKKNGPFFKSTTANFRKFGHGTTLIAQTSQDFVLSNDNGSLDSGIIKNSSQRFLYQIDDSEEVFRERFELTPEQMDEIRGLSRTEWYREVFLQDEIASRVLRVRMTPEEYWRITSTKDDNLKLAAFLNRNPELSMEEALRCMASPTFPHEPQRQKEAPEHL